MHHAIVIDQTDVARFPHQIKGQFIRDRVGRLDTFVGQGGAIAEGNRSGRIIAGIFPSLCCRDQLVEKALAAIRQYLYCGKRGGCGAQGVVGQPLP